MLEMLIVIAIVAVLISVAVPVLSSQLERSREAVDLANVDFRLECSLSHKT